MLSSLRDSAAKVYCGNYVFLPRHAHVIQKKSLFGDLATTEVTGRESKASTGQNVPME